MKGVPQWWNVIDAGNLAYLEKNVPMQHFPPQIPPGLVWDLTQTSTVRGW
jgi:hypothetical protein